MEVHRQKWRALEARRISLPGGDRLCFYEDSLRQLDDAIRAPSTEPELVEERKAVSCWIASREVGLRLPGPSCPVPADISSGQPLEAMQARLRIASRFATVRVPRCRSCGK